MDTWEHWEVLGKGKGTGVEAWVINALGGSKKDKMMKEKGQRGRNQERMEGRKLEKFILKTWPKDVSARLSSISE